VRDGRLAGAGATGDSHDQRTGHRGAIYRQTRAESSPFGAQPRGRAIARRASRRRIQSPRRAHPRGRGPVKAWPRRAHARHRRPAARRRAATVVPAARDTRRLTETGSQPSVEHRTARDPPRSAGNRVVVGALRAITAARRTPSSVPRSRQRRRISLCTEIWNSPSRIAPCAETTEEHPHLPRPRPGPRVATFA
jgi:hypothetical protein